MPGHLVSLVWGAAEWVKKRGLLGLAMSAQMSLSHDLAVAMLGGPRITVIDAELTGEEQKIVGLDKATLKAARTLRTLAGDRYAVFASQQALRISELKAHRATA